MKKINRNKKETKLELKNRKELNIDKKMIPLYSAKKIKVKEPDPNSVLNPLTSSLSPSEKSYGVRFNSASIEGSQINKERGDKNPRGVRELSPISWKLNSIYENRIKKRTMYSTAS